VQYNLALCYEHGDGVRQSKRWAKYYFERAIDFGHKKAKGQLRKLMST
jgi:TPR repeat protein